MIFTNAPSVSASSRESHSRPQTTLITFQPALRSGQLIESRATDPGSVPDFKAWCVSTGHELVEQTEDAGVFRFVIRKEG